MKRWIGKILLWIVIAAAVAYGLDFLSVEVGVPARPQFSTIKVYQFYYINEKFNKFSYEPNGTRDEKCVNALFPHFGARPCWYVYKNRMETIHVN